MPADAKAVGASCWFLYLGFIEGGGFQTQAVPEDSVRFMQAMVKIQPWSLKETRRLHGHHG